MFFFYLIKRHAVKTYGEVEMWLHASLTPVHVGGNLLSLAPAALPPGEVACYVGRNQIRSECFGEEKFSMHVPGFEPPFFGLPVVV
jgi:hypothetical protein